MTRIRGLAYAYEICADEFEGVLIRHHMYKHTQFASQHVRVFITFKGRYIGSHYQ